MRTAKQPWKVSQRLQWAVSPLAEGGLLESICLPPHSWFTYAVLSDSLKWLASYAPQPGGGLGKIGH